MAAGLAVGTGVGAVFGSMFDFTSAGVDISLLNEVAGELNPGKSTVLIEAEEI